jgi:hypothetical protein
MAQTKDTSASLENLFGFKADATSTKPSNNQAIPINSKVMEKNSHGLHHVYASDLGSKSSCEDSPLFSYKSQKENIAQRGFPLRASGHVRVATPTPLDLTQSTRTKKAIHRVSGLGSLLESEDADKCGDQGIDTDELETRTRASNQRSFTVLDNISIIQSMASSTGRSGLLQTKHPVNRRGHCRKDTPIFKNSSPILSRRFDFEALELEKTDEEPVVIPADAPPFQPGVPKKMVRMVSPMNPRKRTDRDDERSEGSEQ